MSVAKKIPTAPGLHRPARSWNYRRSSISEGPSLLRQLPERNTTMRIAIFSKIPPLPATGGNRARIYQLCLRLLERGHDVRFFLIPSQQMGDLDEVGCRQLLGVNRFTIMRSALWGMWFIYSKIIVFRLLGKFLPILQRSNNVDYLCATSVIMAAKQEIRTLQPDIVIAEYVHFSKILTTASGSTLKVLDTHDSFHNEFTDHAEGVGLRRADVVLALQDKEKARFESLSTADQSVITLSHFLPRSAVSLRYTGIIGATFVGSAFRANFTSLNDFIRDVFPLLCQQRPEFQLFVAGSICKHIQDAPNIVKLGMVESLKDAYIDCPILINSISDGTGVKIKLLEAMNLGVPVASTARGVEGIAPGLLEGVAVAPDGDFELLCHHLLRLANNRQDWAEASSKVRTAACRWNATQEEALDCLMQMAKERSRSRVQSRRGAA